MSRFKPILALILLQPLLVLMALILWWWYTRRQQEMVFTFKPDNMLETQKKAEGTKAAFGLTVEDLRKIEGIGPKIASVLADAGITTYSKLAETDVERLDVILKQAGVTIANPQTWPEQARLAAADDWEGLTAYQSTLRGGRPVS